MSNNFFNKEGLVVPIQYKATTGWINSYEGRLEMPYKIYTALDRVNLEERVVSAIENKHPRLKGKDYKLLWLPGFPLKGMPK